ncbi:acyl-CoA desaturase [Achromobacter sp. AGC39]
MRNTGVQKGERLSIVKARVWLIHIACIGAFFVPVSWLIAALALVAYFFRVFVWEAGSHRYFSHRSYKTSRLFQLLLAILAAAGAQRGPIWWASKHRTHHRFSDQPEDPHSPVQRGFWFAHMGWVIDQASLDTDLDAAKDLSKYPELVWVNKYHYLFPYISLAATFCVGEYTDLLGSEGMGFTAAIWIFVIPTVLSLHATFSINTLVHNRSVGIFNRRRFHTNDSTTNSVLLALPTLGASWHNNHHRYMSAAKAGFYWWELDLTYIGLKLLERLRIVWDLRPVPTSILAEGRQYKKTPKSENKRRTTC